MDEYDVFLDEMARKMTLDQLQTYAFLPQQRNRQFIIISPHKLNDVKTNSHVKIIRMADPKRRAAHGLQQQTIDF
jgi:chromosome segregation ATPase